MSSLKATVVRARLQANGCVELPLRGRCMEPLLVAGDRARVAVAGEVCVGDIVLAVLGSGELALHRIIALLDDAAVTKGDFSGKSETLPLSSILGVATAFSFKSGSWVEDDRSRAELEQLAHLSARIGDSSVGAAAKHKYRDTIWEMNQQERNRMMGRAER